MNVFKDKLGRTWDVDINVSIIKHIRKQFNLDLSKFITFEGKTPKSEMLEKLAADPCLLVDVIFLICKAQADEREITDEDFGRAMAGDAIEDATDCLLDAIVEFLPAANRKVYGSILSASRAFQKEATEKLGKDLGIEFENKIVKDLKKI